MPSTDLIASSFRGGDAIVGALLEAIDRIDSLKAERSRILAAICAAEEKLREHRSQQASAASRAQDEKTALALSSGNVPAQLLASEVELQSITRQIDFSRVRVAGLQNSLERHALKFGDNVAAVRDRWDELSGKLLEEYTADYQKAISALKTLTLKMWAVRGVLDQYRPDDVISARWRRRTSTLIDIGVSLPADLVTASDSLLNRYCLETALLQDPEAAGMRESAGHLGERVREALRAAGGGQNG
jgi:hypothetical protein